MKITFLVKKARDDGSTQLVDVPHSEWRLVVEANKALPADQQRYFIVDTIIEDGEVDSMVMEAPRDKYLEWHKEHMAKLRNWKAQKRFKTLSLETRVTTGEYTTSLGDNIASKRTVEDEVCDRMTWDVLIAELALWKPWANELLDLYLQGQKKICTGKMAQKYGVSPQVIRKYKRQFEAFVKKFFDGVSF